MRFLRWSRLFLKVQVAGAFVAFLTASASAQNTGMSWTAYVGGAQATLVFGVPETDNQDFQAVCQANAPDAAILATFVYDTRTAKAGATTLHVAAGEYADEIRIGRQRAVRSEESIAGVTIRLAADDAFWSALSAGSSLLYAMPGGSVSSLNLRGSSSAVKTFIARCRGV